MYARKILDEQTNVVGSPLNKTNRSSLKPDKLRFISERKEDEIETMITMNDCRVRNLPI